METEIKFGIEEQHIAELRAWPALAEHQTEPPRTEELVSTYFDTQDLALHRDGLTLRVRSAPSIHLQTLKLRGDTHAGAYARAEFETPVSSERPDVRQLLDIIPAACKEARALHDPRLTDGLAALFSTRVRRTTWQLRVLSQRHHPVPGGDAGATDIEFAIDEGALEHSGGSTPFYEVELELKGGDAAGLQRFALDLLLAAPLRLSLMSKAERGYALLAGEPARAATAHPLKLRKRDTAEQMFQKMAANCLAQIEGNARGVVLGYDPGSLHQMRVGLRRLRSALDLLKPLIVLPEALRGEMMWLAGELGPARDWHVLASTTLPAAFAAAPGELDTQGLQDAVAQKARRHRDRAAQAVDTPRYARWLMEFSYWLDQKGWRSAQLTIAQRKGLAQRATRSAAGILHKRHDTLLKRGRGLAKLDAHRRHRARIAAKKLRYATEFFASLYARHALRPYSAALSTLQDDLGQLNDAAVADGLLQRFAGAQPRIQAGAGYARGFLAARAAAEAGSGTLRRQWRRFKRMKPPA